MLPDAVRYQRTRNVGFLLIDNPPVNVLGGAVRSGLARALDLGLADEAVQAIVIAGTGRAFSAGADISEFDAPMTEPTLQSLFAAIEAASKPVVVAMHGTVLGGGLELALAGHYRVAVTAATLGLPEITLGLIPGAGGTQRLPRVIGAIAALEMIISGLPVDASEAHRLGLIDAVLDGDLLKGAQLYCESLVAQGAGPRATRARPIDLAGFDSAGIEALLGKHSPQLRGRTTQHLVGEAVMAAAQRDFDAALAVERQIAERSLTTPESKALRHLFFAERQVARARKAGFVAGDALGFIGNKMMLAGYPRPAQLLSAEQPEIFERCTLQLINIGAQAIEAGVVGRTGDIDVACVHAYDFPRHLGGPMFHADTLGLGHVLERMEHYRCRLESDDWQPAALLEELVRRSQSFAQWDSERAAG
ncbi:MAG: enoyl-CoA hydratase-related protein [Pseudomonadota bacterium]|nr:enoyl-CoA hydratase-related protein [Pseudomonadota bacterium]